MVVFALVSVFAAKAIVYSPYKVEEHTVTVVSVLPKAKIEAAPVGTPDLKLDKVKLPKQYDAMLFGEVNHKSTAAFVKAIEEASDQKQVTVRITSPGGEAGAMLVMIQNIEDLKKLKHFKLVCVADLMAASAAFITLETSCDTRLMTYRTMLLAHGVQGGDDGNIATRADSLHETEILERVVSIAVAKRMGMTTDAYLAWIYR